MKTKEPKTVMIVATVLLIGVAICVSVWFFLREYKGTEIQTQSQQSLSNASKATNNGTSKIAPPSHDREEPATRREIITRQSRKMFRSHLSEEQLANPHFQKVLEVMDSPEYAELPMPPSIREWKDLLESKGVPVTRGNPGFFTKQPPFMSLDDYEPIVRQRMAELFLAAEPVDMTDPDAVLSQRIRVFSKLDNVVANGRAWFWERFGDDWDGIHRVHEGMENNPAVIWVTHVQQNAASIVADAKQTRGDALEASAPSWDMSAVMESPSVSHSETEVPTTLGTSGSVPMADAEIEAAIEKSLTPQLPDTPTAKSPDTPGNLQNNLENTLKARFSSERFERAMSTLEQYGPEEGLRRLRENDPEVAKRIEQHRKREEDLQ